MIPLVKHLKHWTEKADGQDQDDYDVLGAKSHSAMLAQLIADHRDGRISARRAQKRIFIPNWICLAPEVPSGRLTCEVDWPNEDRSEVRLSGWLK